jgi:hypothetical protein
MTIKPPIPGEQAHWIVTGQTYATGESAGTRGAVSQRGATFTITDALIQANTSRINESWVNLLHDEEGQVAKWGRRVFAPGPASADMDAYTVGSVEESFAREDARRVAQAIPDAGLRQRALKAVTEKFGIPSSQVSVELDGGRFR